MDSQSTFRDIATTVEGSGKRKWLYVEKPQGRFYNIRSLLSWFYLIVLFGAPFVKVNGHPLFLFNVLDFKFILFGKVFWPQYFYILAIGMIILIAFIALFTLVYGRLFCGWVCPQTIFMEFVFRRIEWLIEGSPGKQKKLNQSPATASKIWKKFIKHLIFFLFSFAIANIFLSYIIGIDALWSQIQNPSEHVWTLVGVVFFSFLFYSVFAFIRDLVCTTICPYGRLQGVLTNKDSVQVAYDHIRGEPRGKKDKSEGDCVDCYKCVHVCPTGIDIRNGSQMECVGCTACIDACNAVMKKIRRPLGLIRYASENQIESRAKFSFTPRMKGFSALLTALVAFLGVLLYNQNPIDSYVYRVQGQLYQQLPNGHIGNLFSIKILNMTKEPQTIHLKLENIDGSIQIIGHENSLPVKEESTAEYVTSIEIEPKDLHKRNTDIVIGVYKDGTLIQRLKTTFYKPFN